MTAPRILFECLEPHHMQVRSGIISSVRLIFTARERSSPHAECLL